MEFAFMTEPHLGGTYRDLRDLALWSEKEGFDAFVRSDHYLSRADDPPAATDAFVTLAGLARDTNQIKLTVLVSPLTFRHPAVIAKSATTIDEMSGGRLELGVGTGWMELEHDTFGLYFPDVKERFDRLEETLAYLHTAFGRSPGGFEGDHYRLGDVAVRPAPTGELPLIVGGSGAKKTPSLAGSYADEFNVPYQPLEELTERLEVVRRSARDAGRDPDRIKVSLIGYPVVGVNEGDYREQLRQRAARRDRDPGEFEALLESRNYLMGPRDRVKEQLAAYEERGVGRLYLQMLTALDEIDTDDVARVLHILRD